MIDRRRRLRVERLQASRTEQNRLGVTELSVTLGSPMTSEFVAAGSAGCHELARLGLISKPRSGTQDVGKLKGIVILRR